MDSVWKNTEIGRFPRLEGDVKTDVLIIGGGICGALTAYRLNKAGVDYILAEAERVGSGTTGNTTAKITVQHGLVYKKMIDRLGEKQAKQYLSANRQALRYYMELDIPCGMEIKDSFVYSTHSPEKLMDEVRAAQKLGMNAEFVKELPLPFETAGAVMFPKQAQFNPMEFLSGITRGLNIYENTRITELAPHFARYENGIIRAKKIIVATHFPMLNKHGGYFLKLYQHRSYVIALENAQDVGGMYVSDKAEGLSFRNYNGLLLMGGGAHKTGKKGGGWHELRKLAKEFYPHAAEKYFWAAQDCMSLDSIPYIGHYSAGSKDIYTASGFNKWGITTSMAASKILADMATGKTPQYSDVFLPHRPMYVPQLMVNGASAVLNLLTPTVPRCPHLGCALKWNPVEHSWDCPCHGSRFGEDGELMEGPATGGLK